MASFKCQKAKSRIKRDVIKFKQGKVKCLESAAIDSPPQKIIAYLWVWEKVPT